MSELIPLRARDYTAKRYRTRAEWLAGRTQSIGASEVAQVMGIAPASWGTALDLWERKRNPSVEERSNADMARGAAAEEHIRELLQIENPDLKVVDMTGIIFRSRKFPWLTCSLDAAIVHEDGTFSVVEIKDVRWTASWRHGLPSHYLYQCVAQLLVTGAKEAVLVARLAFDFSQARRRIDRLCARTVREVPFLVKRDEVRGQFAGIVRETKEFWECVKSGNPPPERMARR